MFKQFIKRKEKLKEKEQSQEQRLPTVEPQFSLNYIPFQDLELGKCYQMLEVKDSMEDFMINKILILSECTKYRFYFNAPGSGVRFDLYKEDLNPHKEFIVALIPSHCSATTVKELSDYSKGFNTKSITEKDTSFFYEDLTKLKLDLESILKQSKLDKEQEIAKQLEETKQSKLEKLDKSFNALQNKLDTYLKQ